MTVWYSVIVGFFIDEADEPLSGMLPAIGRHLTSPAGLWFWAILGMVVLVLPYAAFQSHLLPHWAGQCVGRVYFRPCLPCTIYGNKKTFKGQWWAPVDDGTTPVGGPPLPGQPKERAPPVLLGQAPLFDSQLRDLESMNVAGIVNLCDEFMGKTGEYKKKGMSLLWLKTVDHLEPTVEAMRTAVSFIEHHRKRGSAVYIHCKSGRGRSAAIAMAWLLQVRGMKPLEANQHLLKVRKVRAKLFLQKNVIQFYDKLQEERMRHAEDGLGDAGPSRGLSFATPLNPTNSNNPNRTRGGSSVQRDVLRGAEARPAGGGDDGGFLRNMSFRPVVASAAKTAARFGIGGGAGDESRPFSPSTAVQYGYDTSPPDWDAMPATGRWEVNVAPLPATIPEELPAWAQQEKAQYEEHFELFDTPSRFSISNLGVPGLSLATPWSNSRPSPYSMGIGSQMPPAPPAGGTSAGRAQVHDDASRPAIYQNTRL